MNILRSTAKSLFMLVPNRLHRLAAFEGMPRPFEVFCQRHFRGRNVVGVEVGVFRGLHARSMLKVMPVATLHLVDPWMPFDELQLGGLDVKAAFGHARNILYGEQVLFHRKKSVEVLLAEIDFVYIDADHTRAAEDIRHWWSAVKPGGVIGGHDFEPGHPDVVKAVIEFAVEKDLALNAETPDWWIVKP